MPETIQNKVQRALEDLEDQASTSGGVFSTEEIATQALVSKGQAQVALDHLADRGVVRGRRSRVWRTN